MPTSPELERDRGSPISIVSPSWTTRSGTPPMPLTPLIGRQPQRARVTDLVRGGVRLVTLAGVGGVGKTRLALQLAIDLEGEFADDVVWVPLAAVRDVDWPEWWPRARTAIARAATPEPASGRCDHGGSVAITILAMLGQGDGKDAAVARHRFSPDPAAVRLDEHP